MIDWVKDRDAFTEIARFSWQEAEGSYRRKTYTASLYATPDMIRATEAWAAQQLNVGQRQLYDELLRQGAVRDGSNAWVEQEETNSGYSYSSWTKVRDVRQNWKNNQLEMDETSETGKLTVRRYFKDGKYDAERQPESFKPLAELGVKTAPAPVRPRPLGFALPELG